MQVTVKVLANLKQYLPDRKERLTLDLSPGVTVRQVIDVAGVPWEEVGLVSVNGERAEDDMVLHDGDEVVLVPSMEGG